MAVSMEEANQFLEDFKNKYFLTLKASQGQITDEIKSIRTDYEKVLAKTQDLETILKQYETKSKRPPMGVSGVSGVTEETKDSPRMEAFKSWAITGVLDQSYLEEIPIEERKTMALSKDTTGGYVAAPPEYDRDIMRTVTEMTPLRQYAEVRQTGYHEVQQPMKTGSFAAQWVGEEDSRAETVGLKYGMFKQGTMEMYAWVNLTQLNLEDSAFNLETELNTEFAEQFALAEGDAFINGDGFVRPEGLLKSTHPDIQELHSGDAAAAKWETLLQATTLLKEPYHQNAVWLMRRSTVNNIFTLKDGNLRPIFEYGNAKAGLPPTLYGIPIVYCAHMPAFAGGAFPIILLDARAAYRILDRVGMTVERIRDTTTAATGYTAFIARKRVGGKVKMGEAIVKYEIAA